MNQASTVTALLECRNLHKHFPGTHAVNDLSVSFYPGEVIAIMGENGAGKSTLMKLLAGIHTPCSGTILHKNEPTKIENVKAAQALGIAFIHQELNLAENLSVGANIYLGREPRRFGFIDEQKITTGANELIPQLELNCTPHTIIQSLAMGQRQLVEIAKALSLNADIIIMDEPTSSITQHETAILLKLINKLRDQNKCIVYISHRIKEVQEIADRAIIMRDGCHVGELKNNELEHDRIVSLMVGRKGFEQHTKITQTLEKKRLEVIDIIAPAINKEPISFSLHAGEIVGMAGLVGSGRTELAQTLFGIDTPLGGEIRIDGETITSVNPKTMMKRGMVLVPESRKDHGLVVDFTICDNLALTRLEKHQRFGLTSEAGIRLAAEEQVSAYHIKANTIDTKVTALSGGNQQKVVLAKWLSLNPKVIILDEPTRGIDIPSKMEIYNSIETAAKEGAAILFISSDLDEILRISDRVIVMHEGQIGGELSRDELSEEAVMHLATGNLKQRHERYA